MRSESRAPWSFFQEKLNICVTWCQSAILGVKNEANGIDGRTRLMKNIPHKPSPAAFSQAECCKACGEFMTRETLKSFLLLRSLRLVPSGFEGPVAGSGVNPVRNHGRYISDCRAEMQAARSLWRRLRLTFERRPQPSARCKRPTKCPLPFTSPRAGFPLGAANKRSLEVPRLTFSALWIWHLKPGGAVCGQLCSHCRILVSVGFV